MPGPEPFVGNRIPFDENAPQHHRNGACVTIIFADGIICNCGFQAYKDTDTTQDKKWMGKRRLIVSTCKCGEEFKKPLNSPNPYCQKCKTSRYNATQRKKREGENRKIGRPGKLKAATR